MFESIGRSFALIKTSWNILMDDKKLLVFPVISGILTLVVILTFVLPLILAGAFMSITGGRTDLFLWAALCFLRSQLFCCHFLQHSVDNLCECTLPW